MSDWLDDFENTVRARRVVQQTAEEAQRHKAGVIKAKARAVLDSLTERAAVIVRRYSERFADLPERTVTFNAKPSGGFKLDKATYPAAAVEVNLKDDQISADYMYARNRESQATHGSVLLILTANANDEIEIRTAGRELSTLDDAALFLVERVLKV